MNGFFYQAGKLFGQSRWFASSTPLRFAIACVYLFLFVVLSWAILSNAFRYDFPSPPHFSIPFLGRPYEWAEDSKIGATWVGFIVLILTWIGVVKIAARNQFGSTKPVSEPAQSEPMSVPAQSKPMPESALPELHAAESSKHEPTLFFKSGEAAFESACKYSECVLGEGYNLIAIVVDTRHIVGGEAAVKTLPNGNQLAMLKVSSADGGFMVMSETLYASGPKLEPGDLVSWRIGRYSSDVAEIYGDKRSGWVGIIVAKIKPEYSIKDGWRLDGIFQPDKPNQEQQGSESAKQVSENQLGKKSNIAPILIIVSITVAAGLYAVQFNNQKIELERQAALLKQQELEQEIMREAKRLREEEEQRAKFSPDVLSNLSEVYSAIARATPRIRWSVSGKEFRFVDPKTDDPLGMEGASYAVEQLAYEELKPSAIGYPRRVLILSATPKKLGLDHSCHACRPLIGIFVLSAAYGIEVDASNQFQEPMGGYGEYKIHDGIRLLNIGDKTILLLSDSDYGQGVTVAWDNVFGLWGSLPKLKAFTTWFDLTETGFCGADVAPVPHRPNPLKTCENWKAEISTDSNVLLLKTRGVKQLIEGEEPVLVNSTQRFVLRDNKLVEVKQK
jgi:hypothetical protein